MPRHLWDRATDLLQNQFDMSGGPDEKLGHTTVADRMTDVVLEPGLLFEKITSAKRLSKNWVVPPLMALIVAIVVTMVLFTRSDVSEDIKRMQRLKLYEKAEIGELSQEQLSQASNLIDDRGNVFALISQAIVLPLFMITAVVWWAFVGWIIGDSMAPNGMDYLLALEISGLAATIDIPKYLFFAIASTWLGRIALPNAAIFISDFDPTKKSHLFIGSLDPFNLWKIVLMSVGIAVCGRIGIGKTLGFMIPVWLAVNAALVAVGFGELTQ